MRYFLILLYILLLGFVEYVYRINENVYKVIVFPIIMSCFNGYPFIPTFRVAHADM